MGLLDIVFTNSDLQVLTRGFDSRIQYCAAQTWESSSFQNDGSGTIGLCTRRKSRRICEHFHSCRLVSYIKLLRNRTNNSFANLGLGGDLDCFSGRQCELIGAYSQRSLSALFQ